MSLPLCAKCGNSHYLWETCSGNDKKTLGDTEDKPNKEYFDPRQFSAPARAVDYAQEMKDLTEKVESLERLIKHIFDGHVLINGQFVRPPL